MKILRIFSESKEKGGGGGESRHPQHHGVEITTPETLKQLVLETAVHWDTLAGPLRDTYGTTMDWFNRICDFRETLACVLRTERLSPAIQQIFPN